MGKKIADRGIIPAKTKVIIQIELQCDTEKVKGKLKKMFDQIDLTRKEANQFYETTKKPLKRLLNRAVEKLDKGNGKELGTIQVDKIDPFNGWECEMTMYTVSHNYFPRPIDEAIDG